MEVTNGTVDPAHYGPIGDAARHVASYCDGAARVHVYTAAFTALAAKDAELAAALAKVEKLREALETLDAALTRDMGAGYAGVALCRAILAETQPERNSDNG